MKYQKLAFLLPVLLFLGQLILSLDEISNYMIEQTGLNKAAYQTAAMFTLIVIYLSNQYFTTARKYDRYKGAKRFNNEALDIFTNNIIQSYAQQDIVLRINMMEKRLSIISFLKPNSGWFSSFIKRKVSLFTYKLYPYWKTSNMNHSSDNSIEFCSGQGSCGMALETESVVFSHFFNANNDFNLNKNQKKKTKELKTILSVPIREFDYKENVYKSKIVGIVNFDSPSNESFIFVDDEEALDELRNQALAFSELCSYILS